MNILLTNDDGYYAAGIRELARRLSGKHNVIICAPESERSGSGHMVNFFGGISFKKVDMPDGIETYAVDGTPSDCVIFAVRHLFCDIKFDAVISGINNVLNIGSDIIYSGTVGAAQEGTFQRIPSVAVSLRAKGREDYGYAAEFIEKNLEKLIAMATENITVNVNIPSCDRSEIKGVRVAPIVFRPYDENYIRITKDDEEEFLLRVKALKPQADFDKIKDRDFYVVQGKPLPDALKATDGDCYLVKNGYIVLTPIELIANNLAALESMKAREEDIWL